MTSSKRRALLNRCNKLFYKQVVVDHPAWEDVHPGKLLTGQVIGWSFDREEDDEPVVEVKFPNLPATWPNQRDFFRLSQVKPATKPVQIPTCQRRLVACR